MEINKKYAALLSVGALIGTVGVVALQTHAQQAVSQPVVQKQPATQTAAPSPTATVDKVTPQDTDNIQDPGGVEKPDAPATQVKGTETETNDGQGSDKDTSPDNGSSDQGETNATTPAATK
ncbi:MAG: hypothetical protein P4L74_04455 [Candidatus Doudnabacteria bacterium]|nr:hypothetical protein [Candidatus Doudnabacteria bacterium]